MEARIRQRVRARCCGWLLTSHLLPSRGGGESTVIPFSCTLDEASTWRSGHAVPVQKTVELELQVIWSLKLSSMSLGVGVVEKTKYNKTSKRR